MFMTTLRNVSLLATLVLGLAVSDTKAGFIGSFGIASLSPTINTPGLATATTFGMGAVFSNGNADGGFTGLPGLTLFGPATFTLGSSSGFSFSNSTYGTFTQNTAAVLQSVGTNSAGIVTSEAFFILGSYSGGVVGAATPASITVSFTQNGGPGTSLSASGTLNIPPTAVVPEPASMTMLGLGLATLGGFGLRRRMAK